MSRAVKDIELSKLAKSLRLISFSDEDGRIAALFSEIERHDSKRIRNSYPLPGGKTWSVKIYFAGGYRYLGYTDSGVNAARFADMATLRFWKYRTRGAPEPEDRDFTFSKQQAERDSVNETDAAVLLDEIERHFKSAGVIVTFAEDDAERRAAKRARDVRRTVRGDVIELHEETMRSLGIIARGVEQILKQLKK